MPTLKLFVTLALCALTLSVRADDKTLFIELPVGFSILVFDAPAHIELSLRNFSQDFITA